MTSDIFDENYQVDIALKEFPVTRFQGSKRKIILWINEVFDRRKIEFDSVLDVFGGTGTVSYLFKKMNKSVTYNDALGFNYRIGKALIENHDAVISNAVIENVLNYQSDKKFISETFSGMYYLNEENVFLDNVVCAINRLVEDEYAQSILFYSLFQACLVKRPFNLFHRSNLYIRTADVTRNFGNKTTWEKPFDYLFTKFALGANQFIFDNGRSCKALNLNAFQLERDDYDLVYLDPPYFSHGTNETSNYLKCYHFLEGLNDYENWAEKIDHKTINLRFQSEFNPQIIRKDNFISALESLLENFKKSIIVLSYKTGGSPTIDELIASMKRFKRRVTIEAIPHKYALSRPNGDIINEEVLIIGR